MTDDLYNAARAHLVGKIEQAGFFLGDYDPQTSAFVFREWRPLDASSFETQSAYHLALDDSVRADIIQWAWNARQSLIEVHSHGDFGDACFSWSDLSGFAEWVPHVWWRLRQIPYAAMVTAGETFDGLAWIAGADQPEQVDHIDILEVGRLLATGRTMASRRRRQP